MDDLKYCYTLSELAQKWGKTENEILNIAALGKLWLTVNLDTPPSYREIEGIEVDMCLPPYHPAYFDGEKIRAWLPPLPLKGFWNLLLPKEIAGFLPNNEYSNFTVLRNPEENKYAVVRHPTGHTVVHRFNRAMILIMADEVERFENENPDVISQQSTKELATIPRQISLTTSNENQNKNVAQLIHKTVKSNNHREGGRPLSPLREAVEYLFGKLYDNDDFECLSPGKIQLFIQKFRSLIGKDEYLSERVEKISHSGGKWIIKTQEITAKEDSRSLETLKSKKYAQHSVSKILNELRRKKPIKKTID
ncbi:MAG: hypothetical protein F9K32_04590 [Desulfobulbaceae bacterium]|nr:MAG: hypothetical protein F9K32_04590 [Desulfobulbaceae bacterium]